jgi:hypothetical protein
MGINQPMREWITDAQTLDETAKNGDLLFKKSSLQKIFGSNLTLRNKKPVELPVKQYAALRAARVNFPENELGFILAPHGARRANLRVREHVTTKAHLSGQHSGHNSGLNARVCDDVPKSSGCFGSRPFDRRVSIVATGKGKRQCDATKRSGRAEAPGRMKGLVADICHLTSERFFVRIETVPHARSAFGTDDAEFSDPFRPRA